MICYSAHLSIDVHCSTHLNFFYFFLFKPLIKILQTSLCSIFYFHYFILDLPCSLKTSEASFFFFIISSSLISLIKPSSLIKLIISPISLISPHISSSSHLPTKPKPKPSPFHAVNSQLSPLCLTAAGLPEAQRHQPTPLTHSVETSLRSLI